MLIIVQYPFNLWYISTFPTDHSLDFLGNQMSRSFQHHFFSTLHSTSVQESSSVSLVYNIITACSGIINISIVTHVHQLFLYWSFLASSFAECLWLLHICVFHCCLKLFSKISCILRIFMTWERSQNIHNPEKVH